MITTWLPIANTNILLSVNLYHFSPRTFEDTQRCSARGSTSHRPSLGLVGWTQFSARWVNAVFGPVCPPIYRPQLRSPFRQRFILSSYDSAFQPSVSNTYEFQQINCLRSLLRSRAPDESSVAGSNQEELSDLVGNSTSALTRTLFSWSPLDEFGVVASGSSNVSLISIDSSQPRELYTRFQSRPSSTVTPLLNSLLAGSTAEAFTSAQCRRNTLWGFPA